MKKEEAPGSLERVRLFVNTVHFEPPRPDELGTPERSAAWLRAHEFSDQPITEAEAAQLRELREIIRTVLLGHNGEGDEEAAGRTLAQTLSGTSARWSRRDDALVLEPAGDTNVERVRSAFAIAIYDAMAKGIWTRLKACRKDTCLYAFFDHSKNGSGAWCDMATCGNRVKAAKRRARSGVHSH
jgi:predicted RNA-binding Zn ribbon-like protein